MITQLEKYGLHKTYFQKSRSFLYPALGIPKGSFIHPLQTYISWQEGRIKPEDRKLICMYQGMETEGFRKFESTMLFGNPLFETMYPGEEMKNIYIFNYEAYKKDWDWFLKGKYSEFSTTLRKSIQKYFGLRTREYHYIDSYLFPDQYFELYSKLLDVDLDIITQVGQLCDPYNPEKESLKFSKIDLGILETRG